MSTVKGKNAPSPQDEGFPSAQEIARVLEPVAALPKQAVFRVALEKLHHFYQKPPQSLLLEGGTANERLHVAHFWAGLLNCPNVQKKEGVLGPCCTCSVCVRTMTHIHRDVYFFDGIKASIKIDDVREVRSALGESPRENRFRMVIFHEGQAFVEAAANALLKSLEEPQTTTSFVLLAPQRESLLPTLVSRSMVVTLPWPDTARCAALYREEYGEWEQALCRFMQTGQGLFALTGPKGALTAVGANAILSLCQHALLQCLQTTGSNESLGLLSENDMGGANPTHPAARAATPLVPQATGLADLFAALPTQRLRMVNEALSECQESLLYGVNPTLVLEWFATRLYLLHTR